MDFLWDASFAATNITSCFLLCSSKNRRYIWLQLWEAGIIFRSHLIQAPFDGWSLFGEILDIAIKEISDLSKLSKSPGRERRKASTSKPRFFYYYLFKDTKPHTESFHSFCCWKKGYFSAVATPYKWRDIRKPEDFCPVFPYVETIFL